MTTGRVGEAGSFGPALDHVKHIAADHRIARELVAPLKGPEQRPLLIAADAGGGDPARLRESVRQLLALEFDTLLVGDGESVLRDARQRLRELVDLFPK
jgi:hypothetical protein